VLIRRDGAQSADQGRACLRIDPAAYHELLTVGTNPETTIVEISQFIGNESICSGAASRIYLTPRRFPIQVFRSTSVSSLQIAPWYAANSDQLTANVNGLLFNFEGGPQASFVNGGTPYLINLGSGPNFSGLHMNPSSTGVAPSIIENGSGAVAIRTNVDPSS